ncbi:MAG TPA: dihydrofolate reductase [Burkholderiaceae bacterium]|jgi:dihydrofolate reductase|nr:dihydrofolate reductase [Burkholderiaceae bacterium]
MTRFTLIVAMDAQHGIGNKNKLLVRLPEDMAFFKKTTTGHPIVMGRKTFDSIGRALPNRRNIVITRNPEWRHEGVETASSLDAAAALIGDADAFVIGGEQIYTEALAHAERLLITEIDKTFDADAFFPDFDKQEWQEVAREAHHSAQNEFDFAFVTYKSRSR